MPQETPNFTAWQLIHRDNGSPQSYIDFGFYFLISSCLQRRVWFNNNNPNIPGNLYLNIYVILCGPPGTGKGRVIIKVDELLKYWRIDLQTGKIVEPSEEDHTAGIENYLFPCGPDNTTFEQIVVRMAKSIRRVNNPNPQPAEGEPRVYSHSSMYVCLEELATMMQHDTKKICDFLLKAYDCTDYGRETKGSGSYYLKKPCLGYIAGTTQSFLQEVFTDKLITDGFASRAWLIYEMAPRFSRWASPSPDDEQRKAKKHLLDYIKNLATIYGRVDFTPDANAYMTEWWEGESLGKTRVNPNIKLDSYYARKREHVKKLAAILHFSEQFTSFLIPIETAQRAISILSDAERRMHYALDFGGRNPLNAVGGNIIRFFYSNRVPMNELELLDNFHQDLREMELKECLRVMMATKRLTKLNNGKYYPPELVINGEAQVKIGGERRINGHDLKAIPLTQEIK